MPGMYVGYCYSTNFTEVEIIEIEKQVSQNLFELKLIVFLPSAILSFLGYEVPYNITSTLFSVIRF